MSAASLQQANILIRTLLISDLVFPLTVQWQRTELLLLFTFIKTCLEVQKKSVERKGREKKKKLPPGICQLAKFPSASSHRLCRRRLAHVAVGDRRRENFRFSV